MKGRVTFEPRSAFDAWLERKYAEQGTTQPPPPADDVAAN